MNPEQHVPIDERGIRFDVAHVPAPTRKNQYIATAYGHPLPSNGIAAYGTTAWDAISNAAIGASNYEYNILKRQKRAIDVEVRDTDPPH